jgi:tetratricopeptide (TPR) repeat protein
MTAKEWKIRGDEKDDLGDFEGAIADYDEAMRINPQLAEAFLNRGLAKRQGLGDFESAITDYDEAIRINPQLVEAFLNRGLVKDDLGDFEGAIADYDEAIRINPQNAMAFNNRGLLKRQGFQDFEGAIGDYDEAIRINPQYVEAFFNRGYTKHQVFQNFEGAIADYQIIILLRDPEGKATKATEPMEVRRFAMIPMLAEAYNNRSSAYSAWYAHVKAHGTPKEMLAAMTYIGRANDDQDTARKLLHARDIAMKQKTRGGTTTTTSTATTTSTSSTSSTNPSGSGGSKWGFSFGEGGKK